MSPVPFDTLEFASELIASGVPDQQANAIAKAVSKAQQSSIEQVKHDYDLDNIATKRDLKDTENLLQLKIAESKADLQRWIIGVVFGAGILQTAIIAALVLKLAGHI
jgi:hypothetical protein